MPTISSAVRAQVGALLADPAIKAALAFLEADEPELTRELQEMAVLHGAPFREHEARSPMYREKLEKLGVSQCRVDTDANAYGVIPGARSDKKILVEAHLDTVFDKEVPLAVTEKDGRLYCPGIGDDTMGLAVLLSVVRAIGHASLKPVYSLLVGGSSGEEGEGNIRGIKAMLRDNPELEGCVALEPGKAGSITKDAVGSKRYEFIFTGPGGHSWGDYGLPSPLHAMCRAVAKAAATRTPDNPRTSYTVGVISGGTSVNSIAQSARCKLDMRSVSSRALAELEAALLPLAQQAVEEENDFRAASGRKVTVEAVAIGDRPAGEQPDDAPIVQVAWAVWEALGVAPVITPASSTNANAPISKGIPAVVIRTGGDGGNEHSTEEWFDPRGAHRGAQAVLLLLFTLAGLQGVVDPLPLR